MQTGQVPSAQTRLPFQGRILLQPWAQELQAFGTEPVTEPPLRWSPAAPKRVDETLSGELRKFAQGLVCDCLWSHGSTE